MPVSHRAYGLYGQARTVNAYGHPKTRGPAAVSSFVASHKCLSLERWRQYEASTVKPGFYKPQQLTVETVRAARHGQRVRPLRSRTVTSYGLYGEPDLTVRNFCSLAKNPYGQYGLHGHAPGQPTVSTVTWP